MSQEVEQAALRLLAVREHTRLELGRKLLRRFPSEDVDEVLNLLVDQGLQSDRRFAEQYVESRSARGFGPVRIRKELRDRGVADSLIDSHLDFHDQSWHALVSRVAEQKFGSLPASDYQEQGRRGRFLEHRGFPVELIRDYLGL